MVEHSTADREVLGSNPSVPCSFSRHILFLIVIFLKPFVYGIIKLKLDKLLICRRLQLHVAREENLSESL